MIEQSPLNLGFRPLLEAALDATVVVDSLGRVVALNQEVERLLGWSEQELLGQPMSRLADSEGEVVFPCFQQLM